ncbi:hypothetical protein Bbelb_370060 [Branchiostoma belcheri]|nr:hypothetical protein Bbelb_370060 [Branchiostoma belcheri]
MDPVRVFEGSARSAARREQAAGRRGCTRQPPKSPRVSSRLPKDSSGEGWKLKAALFTLQSSGQGLVLARFDDKGRPRENAGPRTTWVFFLLCLYFQRQRAEFIAAASIAGSAMAGRLDNRRAGDRRQDRKATILDASPGSCSRLIKTRTTSFPPPPTRARNDTPTSLVDKRDRE